MKKITAIIMTLAMIMSVGISAMAATIQTGDQNIDVTAKYQDNSTTPDVYSVDISWGAMQFTYTENGTLDWDPEKHTYTDNTTKEWLATGNTVTVVNHSNKNVTAGVEFTALEEHNTVTGKFDKATETVDAGVVNGYETADKAVFTLTLEGALAETVSAFTKIGTIKVTVS